MGDKVHQRRWWILAVLCLSLLVIVVDNSILNVALPHLQKDLDATFNQLQWMVDSYTLVFACLLLTAGSPGVGVALGPVSGGILLEHFYWGSIFLVNIPIVAVALGAGAYLLPKSRDPE